jgi:hypothetical protein
MVAFHAAARMMENGGQYFSEQDEWSSLEREFASRAVQSIGQEGWHQLLCVQRLYGKEAFLKSLLEIWPDGAPPSGKL